MPIIFNFVGIVGQQADAWTLERGPALILSGILLGSIVLLIANFCLWFSLKRGERGFSISPLPLIFGLIALGGIVSKHVLVLPEWNWYLAKLIDTLLVILVVIFWESWEYFVRCFYDRD